MFKFTLEGVAAFSDKLVHRLIAEKGIEVTENLEMVADQFFEFGILKKMKWFFSELKRKSKFRKVYEGKSS